VIPNKIITEIRVFKKGKITRILSCFDVMPKCVLALNFNKSRYVCIYRYVCIS